jgi:sigma-E factor negative regulatory protein RseB
VNRLAPVAGTVVALTFLAGPSAAAEPAPVPPTAPVSDSQALHLLSRAAQAGHTTAYEGVEFVSRWSPAGTTSLLVDVAHRPGEGTIMRMHGTSTGSGGEVFQASENTDLPPDLAGAVGGPVGLLVRNYSVVVVGLGTVAGRTARIVESRRRDGSVAARFWLDSDTALILRREVFDRQGAMLRASAFIEVSLHRPAFLRHLPPMLPNPWQTRVSAAGLAQLRADGWKCLGGLPTELTLYDVRRTDDPGGPVLHAIYSDGLSTVSLFEQKGRLDVRSLTDYRSERRGDITVYVRDGVQRSVVWSADGTVYTVVADAPEETVEAVIAALPHEHVRTGPLARLERGLGRVASWMNPFA